MTTTNIRLLGDPDNFALTRTSRFPKRRVVPAEVLHENPRTMIVRLPDGHTITRHKRKHCVGAATL